MPSNSKGIFGLIDVARLTMNVLRVVRQNAFYPLSLIKSTLRWCGDSREFFVGARAEVEMVTTESSLFCSILGVH